MRSKRIKQDFPDCMFPDREEGDVVIFAKQNYISVNPAHPNAGMYGWGIEMKQLTPGQHISFLGWKAMFGRYDLSNKEIEIIDFWGGSPRHHAWLQFRPCPGQPVS